jgi:tight adherence protein C
MTWLFLLCGLSVATGVALLGGAFRRSAPRLAGPAGGPRVGVSVAARRQASVELGQRIDRDRRGIASGGLADWSLYRDLAADLRVVDYGVESVIFHQVLTTLGGLAVPLTVFLVILPLGGLTIAPTVALLLAVAFAAGGFYLPIHTLRGDARTRRREFTAGLAQYMSFVDVMVSGGNSIDSSFEFAAELGDGWVWDELRFAIASASNATLAPYRALHGLGEELGVVELTNLARRLEQTQSTGSAIGPALRSLADSLTKDQARQVKVTDDEVTEKMTFPLMVVLCSLLTFFGIAAVTAILRASQSF